MGRRINTGPVLPSSAGPLPGGLTVTTVETGKQVETVSRDLDMGGGQTTTQRVITGQTTIAMNPETDSYIDRLVKYIPAEIIALYLAVTNVIPDDRNPAAGPPPHHSEYNIAMWVVTAVTMLCVPLYMYFITKADNQPPLWSQIIISSIAFPVWVFAIGGPFTSLRWYPHNRWIAAIVISFVTFLVGIYQPKPQLPPDPREAAAAPA